MYSEEQYYKALALNLHKHEKHCAYPAPFSAHLVNNSSKSFSRGVQIFCALNGRKYCYPSD